MIGQLEASLEELLPQPADKDGCTLLYSLDDIVKILLERGPEAEVNEPDLVKLLDGYHSKGMLGTVAREFNGSDEGSPTILYHRKALPSPEDTPPAKRSRRTPLGPAVASIMALRASLGEAQDRLRKLKLLLKSRNEHGDLGGMARKWKKVAAEALEEVKYRLKESSGNEKIRTRQVLQSLGVDWQTVDLDLSLSESESGSGDEKEEEGGDSDRRRGRGRGRDRDRDRDSGEDTDGAEDTDSNTRQFVYDES